MRLLLLLLLASGADTLPLYAQDYPTKPIRIIVPFSPGAATDILARAIAQRFTEAWGQSAIVENRVGAAGMIGSAFVAKSPPDGYTLLMATTSTHNVSPFVYKNVPYDAIKDFAPVALAAYVPNVLTVHPSLPAANLGEFIGFVRTRPGQILYSSSGTGTTLHLAAVLFDQLAGTKMVHVPYKGSGASLTDLVSGQVHVTFATVPTMLPLITAGRLRPLAVTSAKRATALPKIPTIAEAAFPAYEVPNWVGLVAPAQTPNEIVQKLNSEVVKFMSNPDAKQRLLDLGAEPAIDHPQ